MRQVSRAGAVLSRDSPNRARLACPPSAARPSIDVRRSRTRRRRLNLRRWLGLSIAGFLALTVLPVLALRVLDPPTSAFMIAYRLGAGTDDPRVRYRWVDYGDIAASAKIAVIAAEDQRFKDHFGFDVQEIVASIDEARDGGRLRGASTITQQVAKNLFLWSGQSLVRKGLEAYFAVLLELTWPKSRILEVYLNVAEFGHGVYGVEAAADRFFRKHASQLNAWEAARLAAVLPSPRRLRAEAPSAHVRARQVWIMAQARALGGNGYLAALD
jgi:monofunctional biosynthetic peptidoglycan transglycosylase